MVEFIKNFFRYFSHSKCTQQKNFHPIFLSPRRQIQLSHRLTCQNSILLIASTFSRTNATYNFEVSGHRANLHLQVNSGFWDRMWHVLKFSRKIFQSDNNIFQCGGDRFLFWELLEKLCLLLRVIGFRWWQKLYLLKMVFRSLLFDIFSLFLPSMHDLSFLQSLHLV